MPVRTRTKATDSPSINGNAGAMDRLRAALAKMNNAHGEGLAVRGDRVPPATFSGYGIFALDMAMCGGLAEGYATMMYGFESSGKTWVALRAIAGFQTKHPDKVAVFVDAEKLFDPDWASKAGVDTTRLIVITPDTGEQAIDAIAALMDEDAVGLVVLDSVPACVPKAMADRSAEDKTMGALAALMGILCSKIVVSWGGQRRKGFKVSVILLNQWRMKVGFVLGNPRTLPGGRQINHLPTTKIGLAAAYVGDDDNKDKDKDKDKDSTLKAKKSKAAIKTSTEIAFKIEKRKHGAGIDAGAFTLVTGGNHVSGVAPGQPDDAPSVVVFAIKLGLVTGRYALPHFTDRTFAKKSDIVEWVRAGGRDVQLLKATMIMASRVANGLPPSPPDDYLEGIQNVSLHVPDDALRLAAEGVKVSLLSEPTDDETGS